MRPNRSSISIPPPPINCGGGYGASDFDSPSKIKNQTCGESRHNYSRDEFTKTNNTTQVRSSLFGDYVLISKFRTFFRFVVMASVTLSMGFFAFHWKGGNLPSRLEDPERPKVSRGHGERFGPACER